MSESFDKNKIIDCMFDPITGEILSQLENEGKESSELAKVAEISESDLQNKLAYLIEFEFVTIKIEDKKTIYYADSDKLAKIIENNENFDAAIDDLTKMNSYLN